MVLMSGFLVLEYRALAPFASDQDQSLRSSPALPGSFTNFNSIEFVLIPAGEFDMGSPLNEANRDKNEGPVHHVKIPDAFYMGRYEVTQKQWREVMGNYPSTFKGGELPVEQVSWNDVQEFIRKLNENEHVNKYGLPTEAQWEYAARAGASMMYSFGDNESNLGDYAWYIGNSEGKTHNVGLKKPNPFGLYDMNGNVYEWVQDSYFDSYKISTKDGNVGEYVSSSRVFRGGSWIGNAGSCRNANREDNDQGNRGSNLGFRLVRDV
jgi:formylglycine-generating enzyme required for sulfatase activity